jgi:hypothetical protein
VESFESVGKEQTIMQVALMANIGRDTYRWMVNIIFLLIVAWAVRWVITGSWQLPRSGKETSIQRWRELAEGFGRAATGYSCQRVFSAREVCRLTGARSREAGPIREWLLRRGVLERVPGSATRFRLADGWQAHLEDGLKWFHKDPPRLT